MTVYVYPDPRDVMVVMSAHPFDAENQRNASICMHDTHEMAECQRKGLVAGVGGGGGGSGGNLAAQKAATRRGGGEAEGVVLDIDLQTYASGAGWTQAETVSAVSKGLDLLSKVMHHRTSILGFQTSPVNRRLQSAG